MIKTARNIWIVAMLLSVASCEILDTNSNQTVAERLEGQWLVEEDMHLKSTDDFYQVHIDISPVDSKKIIIRNFYGVDSESIEATISGMKLDLSTQELSGGFTYYGSANISANYKQLTWNYFVDDGSGIWKEVNAVYTKDED